MLTQAGEFTKKEYEAVWVLPDQNSTRAPRFKLRGKRPHYVGGIKAVAQFQVKFVPGGPTRLCLRLIADGDTLVRLIDS
jgi:hypothetical protein